jgi:hypothetical protein
MQSPRRSRRRAAALAPARYRLTRVEQLLGCSLKRPATIAELHIALLADARNGRKPF